MNEDSMQVSECAAADSGFDVIAQPSYSKAVD
jgi:hypothetical protein